MNKWEKDHSALPQNTDDLDSNEAAEKLRCRAEKIARQNGFIFNKISIREQKTRWGSCSPKNNISLNLKLNKLPDRIIDYVILHEFVHTRIKNHRKAFWMELGKCLRHPKILDLELRKYNIAFL